MSHKKTITFPDDLYPKLLKGAEASGISLNRYVVRRLSAKNNLVFVNLQELTQALIRLQMVLTDTQQYDDYMRLEVEQLCRFCASFLVRTIKNQG